MIKGLAIERGINPADYHEIGVEVQRGDPSKVMSRTELRKFDECPAKWIAGAETEVTRAMAWGDLMDARVTTPTLLDRFAVAPETYPAPESKRKDAPMIQKSWNMNADYCKDWYAAKEAEGLTPIPHRVWGDSVAAYGILIRDGIARDFILHSETQILVRAVWKDEETGLQIPLKCLVDLVPNSAPWKHYLGDFKTTNNASVRAWRRAVFDQGYYVQAGLYMDCYNAASGEDRNQFAHVIQESEEPYQTARRVLSEDFLDLGRATYRQQLQRYCRCLATNTWPDYDTDQEERGIIYDGFRMVEPDSYMISE